MAMVVVTLGTSTVAGAESDGATSGGQQPQDQAEATPLTDAALSREQAADVAPLAANDLVYNTIESCRLFDTRIGSGPIGDGRPVRGFDMTYRGFCDLPSDGSVKAVMVNLIAITTRTRTGGYVRASEWPTPANEGATVLNFNNGLVSSNAVPLNMCDTSTTDCDSDVSLIVKQGSANIVVDVIGYFST